MESQEIVLYTIGCPHCIMLERLLKQKGIQYKEIRDEAEMRKLGFKSVPVLKIGDQMLTYAAALKWVKEYDKEDK